jgi:hypothetical protein
MQGSAGIITTFRQALIEVNDYSGEYAQDNSSCII